jgi:hypothetical protein
VAALYADVRTIRRTDPAAAHAHWRAARDNLFGRHPQTALTADQQARFAGLRYFPYDPALAFEAQVVCDEEPATASGPGLRFHRIGFVEVPVGRLALYWIDDYAGGLFLPFRDATSGDTTYGGGRYLLDTAKSADLGSTSDGKLVLDFNFAYHPSCHYNPAWVCPLAPPENRLAVRIEAGEMAYA